MSSDWQKLYKFKCPNQNYFLQFSKCFHKFCDQMEFSVFFYHFSIMVP